MEKYCIKCRISFDDMKYNSCPICKEDLIEREVNRHIPPELRHKIFVRDGYRCRECGKGKKETSLEIDHIFPISKGGPSTEENLQVLCTQCNRDKKDDEWKDKEIDVCRNALSNLETQLQEHEESLKVATTEEEIYDLKAKIKRIRTVEIPEEEEKLKRLIEEEKHINAKWKACQEENRRRKNLFNKIYIDVEGELLLEVCNHFSLTEPSDEDNIRLLIDKHSEEDIFSTVSSIKEELEREAIRKALYDKLNNTLSPCEVKLFMDEFSLQCSKHELLNYLIQHYSEDEIESLKIKLIEKERKRIEEERKRQEELERKREEERIKKLIKKLNKDLTPNERDKLYNEFSNQTYEEGLVEFLANNLSEDEIEEKRIGIKRQEELKRQAELKRQEEECWQKLFDFEHFSFQLPIVLFF